MITLTLNLATYTNNTVLEFISDASCTSISHVIVAGGIDIGSTGGTFQIQPTSNTVIIEYYALCNTIYDLYLNVWENGENCNQTTFTINSTTCNGLVHPIISYDCETGLDISPVGPYSYNIQPNTILLQGDYTIIGQSANGCYFATSLNVPDCCPNYTVGITANCLTNFENEIHVIIYDASGNPAITNINSINFERIDGTSFCVYGNVDVNLPNSPTGVIVNNICAGSYNLSVNTTLSIGCVIGNQINIDCTCVDCTPNPFDDCCNDLQVAYSTNFRNWCTDYDCGNTVSGANCGGDINKLSQSWIVDTSNPLYQGLFAIQFIPSAVPDAVRIYQDNILIAESPAVGFWNNTFCPTDDVLGFWTNGTYNNLDQLVTSNGGSIDTPWIYNALSNPGVSGQDRWFNNGDIQLCDNEEGAACPNYELGMKDRRGAGELFFYITPTASVTAEIKLEILFAPNCTQCTQDCIPYCPFCDGVHTQGASFFSILLPSGSCESRDACATANCYTSFNSVSLASLPYFNIDNIKKNDNDGPPSFDYSCSDNGTVNCNPQNAENPYGYVTECDGANIGNIGNISHKSGIKWRIRAYNTATCNPEECEIEYKDWNVQTVESGEPQFIWAYNFNVLSEVNATLIITVPTASINLDGLYIYQSATNTYLQIQAVLNNPTVFSVQFTDGIVESSYYYGLFQANIGGTFSNAYLTYPGDYSFYTFLPNNIYCSDLEIFTITGNESCMTIIVPENITWCKGNVLTSGNTFITGRVVGYEDCAYKQFNSIGLPPSMSTLMNWNTGTFYTYGVTMVTGNYNVLITATCDSCVTTGIFNIDVPENDCSVNTVITNPSCGGNNGSIEISTDCVSSTIVWIWPPSVSGNTNFIINSLPVENYTYQLTNSAGCIKQDVITLINTNGPSFDVFGILMDCDITVTGMTIDIENILTTGATVSAIQVFNETGLLDNYITSATAFTTTNEYPVGSYTIHVIDSNGCESIKFMNIYENLNPIFNVNGYNLNCDNVGYIMTPQELVTGNYEIWYSSDELDCSNFLASGVQVTGTILNGNAYYIDNYIPVYVSGIYSVCLYDLIDNCCNCKNVLIGNNYINVTEPVVNAVQSCYGKKITISQPNICSFGTHVQFYANTTGNLIVNNSIWNDTIHKFDTDTGQLSIGGIFNGTLNHLPVGTYTYYARCQENGCYSDYEAFNIYVRELPIVELYSLGSTATCQNGNLVVLTTGATQFTFAIDDVVIQNGSNSAFNFDFGINPGYTPIFHTITVTGTSVYNCKGYDSIEIVHWPSAHITTNPITVCWGSGIVYNIGALSGLIVDGLTIVDAITAGYTIEYQLSGFWGTSSWTSNPNMTIPIDTTSYKIRVLTPFSCGYVYSTNQLNMDPAVGLTSITPTFTCDNQELQLCVATPPIYASGVTWSDLQGYIPVNTTGICVTITGDAASENNVYTVTLNGPLTGCAGGENGNQLFLYYQGIQCPEIILSYPDTNICVTEIDNTQLLSPILSNYITANYFTINSSNQSIVQNYPAKTPPYGIVYHTNVDATVTITAVGYTNFYDTIGSTIVFNINFLLPDLQVQNINVGEPLVSALVYTDLSYGSIYYTLAASAESCTPTYGVFGEYGCCQYIGDSFLTNQNTILPIGQYVMFGFDGSCCVTRRFNVMGAQINNFKLFNVNSSSIDENNDVILNVIYLPNIPPISIMEDTASPLPNYYSHVNPLHIDYTSVYPNTNQWYSFLGEQPIGGWSGGVWNESNKLYYSVSRYAPFYKGVEYELNYVSDDINDGIVFVKSTIIFNNYYSIALENNYNTDYNYYDLNLNPSGYFASLDAHYPVSGEFLHKTFFSRNFTELSPSGRINYPIGGSFSMPYDPYTLTKGKYTLITTIYSDDSFMSVPVTSVQYAFDVNECSNTNTKFQPIHYYSYDFWGLLGDRVLFLDQKRAYQCSVYKIYATNATDVDDYIVSGYTIVAPFAYFGNKRSVLIPNNGGADISCRYIDDVQKTYVNLELLGLSDNTEYDIMFERERRFEEPYIVTEQRWGFRFDYGTAYNNMSVVNVFKADGIISYSNLVVSGTSECELIFTTKEKGQYKIENYEDIGYVTKCTTGYTIYNEFENLLIPRGHAVSLYKHYDDIYGVCIGLGTVNTNIINVDNPLISTYIELVTSTNTRTAYDNLTQKGIKYVNPIHADDSPYTTYQWNIPPGLSYDTFSPIVNWAASFAVNKLTVWANDQIQSSPPSSNQVKSRINIATAAGDNTNVINSIDELQNGNNGILILGPESLSELPYGYLYLEQQSLPSNETGVYLGTVPLYNNSSIFTDPPVQYSATWNDNYDNNGRAVGTTLAGENYIWDVNIPYNSEYNSNTSYGSGMFAFNINYFPTEGMSFDSDVFAWFDSDGNGLIDTSVPLNLGYSDWRNTNSATFNLGNNSGYYDVVTIYDTGSNIPLLKIFDNMPPISQLADGGNIQDIIQYWTDGGYKSSTAPLDIMDQIGSLIGGSGGSFVRFGLAVAHTLFNIQEALIKQYTTLNLNCCREDGNGL